MQSPPLVTQRLGREQLKFSPPLYIFVAVVRFQFFRFGVQKSSKFTSAFEHLHIYVFMEMMLRQSVLSCCSFYIGIIPECFAQQHFLRSWSKQTANKNTLEILLPLRNF